MRNLHSEKRDERASPVFFSGKQMMTMFCYGFQFLYWGAENIIFLNVKNFQYMTNSFFFLQISQLA